MPISGVKDHSMPEILLPDSLSNQFKAYLIALEHLAIDMPQLLATLREQCSDDDLIRRFETHIDRINAASKAR